MFILAEGTLFDGSQQADQPLAVTGSDMTIRRAARLPADVGCVVATDDRRIVHVEGNTFTTLAELDADVTALVTIDHKPMRVLVGTREAQLLTVDAKGAAVNTSFASLDVRDHWHTPWGGPAAVRTLARAGDCVYADIHVGSIMRSEDAGATWEPVDDAIEQDVHEVATCPAAPDRVYANTANAVWISDDRGRSWQRRPFSGGQRYGRAIAIHPAQPDCLLASVSNGPHGGADARLYRSSDAGATWHHVTQGFPESHTSNIDTGHIAFDSAGRAWAALGERVFVSDDEGRMWRTLGTMPAAVKWLIP